MRQPSCTVPTNTKKVPKTPDLSKQVASMFYIARSREAVIAVSQDNLKCTTTRVGAVRKLLHKSSDASDLEHALCSSKLGCHY